MSINQSDGATVKTESAAQLLRTIDLFKSLDEARLTRLAASASKRELIVDDVLLAQGST